MRKNTILFVGILLLAACSSTNTQTNVTQSSRPRTNIPNNVGKVIKGLEGCKKDFVFEVMGIPDQEKFIDGQKYFSWDLDGAGVNVFTGGGNKYSCTVNAHINSTGIIDNISYNDYANGCKHIYVRIVRYYRANPPQSAETCPSRTDFQGIHRK